MELSELSRRARFQRFAGLVPKELSADSGYFCREDIEKVEAKGVEAFVAAGRAKHGQEPQQAPRGRPPKGLSFKERMKRKLQTKRGRRAYARRKVKAEPVIGQVKHTVLGRFSLRGLVKVSGEFSLACAVHNLKKLWQLGWELPTAGLEAAAWGGRRPAWPPSGTPRPVSLLFQEAPESACYARSLPRASFTDRLLVLLCHKR